jgi:hypothetical protein
MKLVKSGKDQQTKIEERSMQVLVGDGSDESYMDCCSLLTEGYSWTGGKT